MAPAKKAGAFLRENWALLLPAFVLLTVFPYLPALRSPNELVRLYQTRAVVDLGTFEITRILREQGPVGDLSCVAIARDEQGRAVERRACPLVRGQPRFREQHYYSSKAPLLATAAVPIYAALERLGGPVPEAPLVFFARLFLTVLPTLGVLVLVRRFLRAHVEPRLADGVTATYGLGTLAFSYSSLFMSHQTTAGLLFACFYALWRLKRGEWAARGYAVAGLLGGLVVAAEYTGTLGLVPLSVYALATAPGGARGKLRAVAYAAAGALPPLLALAAYHHACFGDPLSSSYSFLNDEPGEQDWPWPRKLFGVPLPDGRAFVLSFLSPLRGLFTLSPVLALALPGLARRSWIAERRAELALSAGTLLLYTYFTACLAYDSWGWTTGPRHLTPLVPFLLLPVALALEQARAHRVFGVFAAGLAATSILVTSAMTLLNYIPDSLTNAMWQVCAPLLASGHFPHTWLSLAGIPNPWAGLPAAAAIAATALLVALALAPDQRRAPVLAGCAAVVLAFALAHSSFRPADGAAARRDRDTAAFLEERYLPRPGHASPPFWGRW